MRHALRLGLLVLALTPLRGLAGAQKYEPLSASVQAALYEVISDHAAPRLAFADQNQAGLWLADMSQRLEKKMPNHVDRQNFLVSVQYEATRAGLDPQLILGLIQVESNFRKYAVSSSSARGFMQVMPFWVKLLGRPADNLFNLRTNLRYGCTILRHYLDIENGNLFRALGRYNGSLGQADYPNLVLHAWQGSWKYPPSAQAVAATQAGRVR